MRFAIFLSLLAVSYPLLAKEELAYLILKSEVINDERQPTWISLMNHGRYKHVPANKEIVEVTAGSYYVHHVDFMETTQLGNGTQNINNPQIFEVEGGHIYFIGNLLLRRKSTWRYEMGVEQSTSQIIAACNDSPEIFAKYPLVTNSGAEKIMLNCSEGEN